MKNNVIKICRYFTIVYSLASSLVAFSQGHSVMLGSNNGNPEYLVGKLPTDDAGNLSKLKVEIFGGNWHNSNLGENTYYISSRDGILVNQEVHGGSYSRYKLKIYDNGNGFDAVIKITDNYPSFHIRSWTLTYGGLKENSISEYNNSGSVDITAQVPINTLYASTNSGNVGIGIINPDSKLTVKGNIHAQEVKVDLGGAIAPDYVFKEDYNLKTLDEVEKYIQKEGHLPNIPSAKEMEKEGIHLKEMNLKLLEKIEELTLYVIEQEKRIEKLEQKNKKSI